MAPTPTARSRSKTCQWHCGERKNRIGEVTTIMISRLCYCKMRKKSVFFGRTRVEALNNLPSLGPDQSKRFSGTLEATDSRTGRVPIGHFAESCWRVATTLLDLLRKRSLWSTLLKSFLWDVIRRHHLSSNAAYYPASTNNFYISVNVNTMAHWQYIYCLAY